MKKYIIYTFLFGLLFTACNPNKDIYQNIDDNRTPYRTDFEITLAVDDYSTISDLAENDEAVFIEDNLCFSNLFPASLYVGAFLDEEYIAPGNTSSVLVTYDYSVNEYDTTLINISLTEADYLAVGGVVADSLAFTYNELPETYLPDYLATFDTIMNRLKYVQFEYWKNDTTKIDSSIAYEFIDGAWTIPSNIYIINGDDYDAMGLEYGNFSSSATPGYYLPIFLSQEHPYAHEDDMFTIIYKYYSGGSTTNKMAVFYFDGTIWKDKYQLTDQFIQNGTQWVFDPTVSYNMVKEDYDILVQYIANNEDPNIAAYLDANYGNTEYYYGASSYYGNFDMRLYKRRDNDPSGLLEGLSDDEAKANLTERLKEGLQIYCELRFPTANALSNGVQVYYEIYYATYEPGDYFYKMRFKVTDTGKFEYESGPELLD